MTPARTIAFGSVTPGRLRCTTCQTTRSASELHHGHEHGGRPRAACAWPEGHDATSGPTASTPRNCAACIGGSSALGSPLIASKTARSGAGTRSGSRATRGAGDQQGDARRRTVAPSATAGVRSDAGRHRVATTDPRHRRCQRPIARCSAPRVAGRSTRCANPTCPVDFRRRPARTLWADGTSTTMKGTPSWPSARKSTSRSSSKGYRFDWKDAAHSVFEPKRGLNEQVVEEISALKNEPDWMRKFRLKSLRTSTCARCPGGAPTCPTSTSTTSTTSSGPPRSRRANWDELPDDIKDTWDKLGIPEAEKKYLGGVSGAVRVRGRVPQDQGRARRDRRDLHRHGLRALRDYPDLVKEHFGTVIPPNDNKFAALNTAVWSGGSFIYVPPGVHVDIPLQAYFRINAENMGQFERTLIIADEGSLRALRRGLLGPDLHERLAALRRRRDQGEEGRARPLHDDPELVDQRVQPRHEARGRPTRTP